MKLDLSRRKFVSKCTAGTLGAMTLNFIPVTGRKPGNSLPAILGGEPIRKNKSWKKWPFVDENIMQSIMETAKSGTWCRIQRGSVVPEWEKEFAKLQGSDICVAVGSGTQALHTSLEALGIGAGDEVITSPCTDPGTIASILNARALPVLADIDRESFQNDPDDIERRITNNTKAIMPVHIGGAPCDLARIMEIAKKHNLFVVEDSCQCALSEYKGKKLGTFGDLGCFSFQSSKTIACGEGGAIIGNDPVLMDKCYTVQNHGTNRKGLTETIGPKYRMNDFEAAILLGSLASVKEQFELRNENGDYLTSRLKEIPGIIPQKRYEGTGKFSWYLIMIGYHKEHFNDLDHSKFIKALRAEGIPFAGYRTLNREPWVDHILNLNVYKQFFSEARLKQYHDELPLTVAEKVIDEELCLIHSSGTMLGTKEDMDDIADAIIKIYDNSDKLKSV